MTYCENDVGGGIVQVGSRRVNRPEHAEQISHKSSNLASRKDLCFHGTLT